MLDGPVSWLSVDLKVFKITEDGYPNWDPAHTGLPHGTSASAFIDLLLRRFNNRTNYPGDQLHPFNDIDPDQEASHLEWMGNY